MALVPIYYSLQILLMVKVQMSPWGFKINFITNSYHSALAL